MFVLKALAFIAYNLFASYLSSRLTMITMEDKGMSEERKNMTIQNIIIGSALFPLFIVATAIREIIKMNGGE